MEIEQEGQEETGKDSALELARRRELGELDSVDYDLISIFHFQESGKPVSRKDVDNQAIVVQPDQFDALMYIELVTSDGESITIDFDDLDTSRPFILFPEDLGDLPSES